MSITSKLKQITLPTLELLQQNPKLIDSFFDAELLPESSFWEKAKYWDDDSAKITKQQARARFGELDNYDWQTLEIQSISVWETPELDLHKYFLELTYLLAGYIPAYYTKGWIIPELEKLFLEKAENNNFSLELRPPIVQKIFRNSHYKDFLPFLVIENSEWDNLP